jgi:hypothetical protein
MNLGLSLPAVIYINTVIDADSNVMKTAVSLLIYGVQLQHSRIFANIWSTAVT